MKDKYSELILEKYQNKENDFSELFQMILIVADEMGLEKSLGYSERWGVRIGWRGWMRGLI